jgi:hypothetical protein
VIVKSYYRFNIKQAGAMRFNFCMPSLGQGFTGYFFAFPACPVEGGDERQKDQ